MRFPYRQHLLVHTARTEGYSKLMLADHCTRLAIKLLASISLGRGAQLAQDTVRKVVSSKCLPLLFRNHLGRQNQAFIALVCVRRGSQT